DVGNVGVRRMDKNAGAPVAGDRMLAPTKATVDGLVDAGTAIRWSRTWRVFPSRGIEQVRIAWRNGKSADVQRLFGHRRCPIFTSVLRFPHSTHGGAGK